MRIEPGTGWLAGARRVPSPNRDRRPGGAVPELLVVHSICLPPGEFGGPWIERFFTNELDPDAHPYFSEIAGMRVSAHALVRRDGEVVQFVPFDERAWHAGESCWEGRSACNDFSVGVELEGSDDREFEPIQYERLALIARELERTYPAMDASRIVGHCDIAPGRKTDPGPHFDWDRLKRRISGESR